ncbi:MAG: HEAT repeat domain-containing protein, partial [Acidobacteria bacterium]|nr:HEAT repeat domain-containing protein [Acidobacteriota bacterium]
MNNKVLYLSVIIILSISMVTFSASTDIKSEELIEGVFISDNHDYWNYSVYSDFTFVMSSLIYNDYFIPLREEYREKLIEYQSRTKFSPTSLSRLISSENWHVRTTGIYLTVKQGENSLLTIIRNSIKDENPAVRFNAIKALGELDKNLKPEFFLAIIKNTKENPYPRAAAISVLTPWIKKDIYQYIKNLPGISDPLDYWIAWSIGYLKITEGYPKLMKMLSSDDACVIQMSL